MHVRIAVACLTITALPCPACAPDDEDAEFRMTSGSGSGSGSGPGTVFNTNIVDDAAVSELLQPMGDYQLGIALTGVRTHEGEIAERFAVAEGELSIVGEDGAVFTKDEVLGSTWQLLPFNRLIWSSMVLAERRDIDGWPHYRFTRGPLGLDTCVGEPPIYARLLTGFTLDESTGDVAPLRDNTYVACDNGATGKAAALGYYDLAVGLGDFKPFEVAIRAIRADYCYDGVSHTTPGVELRLADRWGIRAEASDRPLEAVWGAEGLLCFNTGRAGWLPGCNDWELMPGCLGDNGFVDHPDALFITRLP
ncbi:ADYC domain-containing protein [Nannocystis pusilla]|uniref:ADYC domain-containing protein n=1 Tax=Nannocystis pusilla TaxID=889268 RepID=A0ABS7U6C2_9BACT|nr:ADYC domain-containing protein [Nannocystis pusilla]MBZ5715941.1 hypothetical protein [Nannocystis pusilla]